MILFPASYSLSEEITQSIDFSQWKITFPAQSKKGNALDDLGRLEEALAAYNKALEIKPDYAEAYYNMGNALLAKGKAEEDKTKNLCKGVNKKYERT